MAAPIKFEGNIGGNDPYYLAAHDNKRSYLSFDIAQTSPRFKDGKFDRDEEGKVKYTDPAWYKVVAFGENADKIKDAVKSGDRIEVKGKLGAPEAYLTKDGTPAARTVIIANKVELVNFDKKTETEALEEMRTYGEYNGNLVDEGIDDDYDHLLDEQLNDNSFGKKLSFDGAGNIPKNVTDNGDYKLATTQGNTILEAYHR